MELFGLDIIDSSEELAGLGNLGDASNAYDIITNKILDAIDKEGKKWVLPWAYAKYVKPMNFKSKRVYQGINNYFLAVYLENKKLTNPYFLTSNQVEAYGGVLDKKARGKEIFFWSQVEVEDEKVKDKYGKNKTKVIPILKYYYVYHASEITGINWGKIDEPKEEGKNVEFIESAEAIIDQMPNKPKFIKKDRNRAFYSMATDSVNMPDAVQFSKVQEYYSTFFHELVHSTGHPKRLNRKMGARFGDSQYAYEELIAEIGAAFLCGESGILHFTFENSVAYLKGWENNLKKLIQDDKRAILKAVKESQQAADFIMNKLPESSKETQIVSKYISLHNKTHKLSAIKKFVEDIQNSIKSGSVKKYSPLAPEINTIQKKLVKVYNECEGEVKEVAIRISETEKKRISKIVQRESVKSEKVKSVKVRKKDNSFHGFGEIGEKVKSEETVAPVKCELVKEGQPTLNKFGLVRASEVVKAPDSFRLSGEMGEFLQDIQAYKCAIVITGDPHAGKTEFLTQLLNSFLEYGKSSNKKLALFSLEQGGMESKDTSEAVNRNITKENKENLLVTGVAENGIETIKEAAKEFDIIAIDSWQELKVPVSQFNDLRKEFPNVIFIIIFQQNGEGGTRGGVKTDYDANIRLKVNRVDDTFKNNFVSILKNRGNSLLPTYNIHKKKTSQNKQN